LGVLVSRTNARWVEVAMSDLDSLLDDHAHCEKKAAASALALIVAYPAHDELVRRLSALAIEELQHFRMVHERIVSRGRSLGGDKGDPYAKKLLSLARANEGRLTDRLLLLGLIEARSRERLELLAENLRDPELARFYRQLSEAEGRHADMFRGLASNYDELGDVEERLSVLSRAEARIVASLPLHPRIH
jgi:tRNA-(ms[2]io[6]A)-hydroxylase